LIFFWFKFIIETLMNFSLPLNKSFTILVSGTLLQSFSLTPFHLMRWETGSMTLKRTLLTLWPRQALTIGHRGHHHGNPTVSIVTVWYHTVVQSSYTIRTCGRLWTFVNLFFFFSFINNEWEKCSEKNINSCNSYWNNFI